MAVLVIGIVVYQLPNRSAQIVNYRYMVGDLTYWFKNCVAATKGYPLPELSINGLHLYWHLFSCFEVAFLHFVTGMEIYELCFTFAYIWQIFLLVGGTYTIAAYLLKKRSYIFLALLAVLFTSGMDNQTWVFYQYHLYRCSLAFIEGYAMSMFGLFILFAFTDLDKKNATAYGLTVLMLAGSLGLKASGGVILLAAMAVRLVFCLGRNGKKNVRYIFVLLSYLAAFYVVANFILIDGNALSSSTSSHQLRLFTIESVLKSGYYRPVFETLKVGFLNKYVAYIVTAFIYLIHANYAVFVPLLAGIALTVYYRDWKKFLDITNVTLACMVLGGLGIFFLVDHPGFSQVYFMFEVFPFAVILGMRLIEGSLLHRQAKYAAIAVEFLLIMGSICYNYVNWQSIYRLDADAYLVESDIERSFLGDDVSDEEIEGLRWVRENLGENVVLATNKILIEKAVKTFITSEFTERQVYLEGYASTNLPSMDLVDFRLDLLSRYYGGEEGAMKSLMDEGVTHAVLFKGNQDPSVQLEGNFLYENNAIAIIEFS